MHELSIAKQMIDAAVALLPPEATSVSALRVQVGALAGVSADELRFGFETMCKDTQCAQAELLLETMPAVARCSQCSKDFTVHEIDGLRCPTCGSYAVTVVQGKDLIITSLDVTTEDTPWGDTPEDELASDASERNVMLHEARHG